MFHGLLFLSYTYITRSLLSHRSVLPLYRITPFFLMSSEPNMTVSGGGHLTCSGSGNFTVTAPSGTTIEMNMSFGGSGDLYAFHFENDQTIDPNGTWDLYSQLLNYSITKNLNSFFNNEDKQTTLSLGQNDTLKFKFRGRALNGLNNDFMNEDHVQFYYKVDSLVIPSVAVATTENMTLSGTPASGIDGYNSLSDTNRILVKHQTDQTQNGVYVYNSSGAWTRATDFDAPNEINGAFVFVENGTANGSTGWVCTNDDATAQIGVTAIAFEQFSSLGLDGQQHIFITQNNINGWIINASEDFANNASAQGTNDSTFISFQPTTSTNTRPTVYFKSSREDTEFEITGPS